MDLNDTPDNAGLQVIGEQAKAGANTKKLIAQICVPYIEKILMSSVLQRSHTFGCNRVGRATKTI
jgi:hypothetical protein